MVYVDEFINSVQLMLLDFYCLSMFGEGKDPGVYIRIYIAKRGEDIHCIKAVDISG
jgi:hypothetical protein